jgi:hypothetical protein
MWALWLGMVEKQRWPIFITKSLTLQTTSPAMRQKTARGYKLTMALLPSSAWLG